MAIIIETCPECGHDLVNMEIATYPPIPVKECPACGWRHEGEPEEIVRIPFGGNSYRKMAQHTPLAGMPDLTWNISTARTVSDAAAGSTGNISTARTVSGATAGSTESVCATVHRPKYEDTDVLCNVCQQCNVLIDTSVLLTTDPPKYRYRCPYCGNEFSAFRLEGA